MSNKVETEVHFVVTHPREQRRSVREDYRRAENKKKKKKKKKKKEKNEEIRS